MQYVVYFDQDKVFADKTQANGNMFEYFLKNELIRNVFKQKFNNNNINNL